MGTATAPALREDAIAEARALLRGAGLAATRVRLACLAAVLSARGPVTRRAIAREIPGGRADRVTLYRTLRTLEASGLARREVGGADGETWCPAPCEHGHRDCPGHMHFECVRCGRMSCVRVEPARVTRALGAAFAAGGLAVASVRVRGTGVCPSCATGALPGRRSLDGSGSARRRHGGGRRGGRA